MVFSVLQIVAPVFVIIAAGYAALRLGYLEASALAGLSAFVLRVALPALVFNALAGAPVGETMDARYLAGYCAGSLAVFAAGYLWARRDGRDAGVCAMQGLGMSVSNSGSVGFPIATLVIGAGAAPILAQTMIVENLVMLPHRAHHRRDGGVAGRVARGGAGGDRADAHPQPAPDRHRRGDRGGGGGGQPAVCGGAAGGAGRDGGGAAGALRGGRAAGAARRGRRSAARGGADRRGQARGASVGGRGGASRDAGARPGAAGGRAPVRRRRR